MGRPELLSVWLDISFVALTFRPGVGTRHQTQHGIDGDDGGAAVADQRKGQADNRHGADAHADVDHHLKDQRGSRAEADQPPLVVLAPNAHEDAPGDNGQLQNHHQNTAQEPQLLADGGENIVRVLGEEVAALGTVALEKTLARQTAAGEGLKVHAVVVALVGALGVNGLVEEDQDPVLLVGAQKREDNGETHGDEAQCQGEPQQADTAGESHADKDKHEDQGNACVLGDDHVQANEQHQMEHHMEDRGNAGYTVLVGVHDRCHDEDIGDLTDLRRLDIDDGRLQPASVTGVVVGAEGDQHQQQKAVESHQHIPVFGHGLHIQRGSDGKEQDTQRGGGQLDDDVPDVAAEFIGVGSTGQHDDTKKRCDQTQNQQHPVALFGEALQFGDKLIQGTAPFLSAYFSID